MNTQYEPFEPMDPEATMPAETDDYTLEAFNEYTI
jgi:hypothetical protein